MTTTIAGLPAEMVHEHDEWNTSSKPVRASASFPWGDITNLYVHYTGGRVPWFTSMVSLVASIVSSHLYYLRSRGYAYGYSFLVYSREGHPLDGHVFVIRGFRWRNAANAGRKVEGNANHWSVAVQVMVDGQNPASELALRSVRAIGAEVESRQGNVIEVAPHLDVDYTLCCGDGAVAQVRAGLMDPASPIPATPTEEEEEVMPAPAAFDMQPVAIIWSPAEYANAFLIDGGNVVHCSPDMAKAFTAMGIPFVEETEPHPQALRSVLIRAGLAEEADRLLLVGEAD